MPYTYNNVNALTTIADSTDANYSCNVTCDANGNITQVSEVQDGTPSAGLVSAFTYDALNRLTVMEATRKESGVTQYTKRHHGYDGLGRLTSSALTQWDAGQQEPTPDYRDHMYAGARHIGNASGGLMSTTYGERWHWAGAQNEHAAPLESPNADTAGQKGYNIARQQSPQQATWQSPTTTGDDKLLYGQGRPMAKDAVGGGANFADGLESENTGGTVTVESRLFFDGTVASSSSANDLSRATDAREKGRIGIFGSAVSYAGSYGRVTSESIGRDLNPLGRGDGSAYVAGGMNLGRISPALPWNNSPGGWGNSVNNGCGRSSGRSNYDDPIIILPDPDPWFTIRPGDRNPWGGVWTIPFPGPNPPNGNSYGEHISPWPPGTTPTEIIKVPFGEHVDPWDPLSPTRLFVEAVVVRDPCACCYDSFPSHMDCDDIEPLEDNPLCSYAGASYRWPNAASWCCMWKTNSYDACGNALESCVEHCLLNILLSIVGVKVISKLLSLASVMKDIWENTWGSLIGDIMQLLIEVIGGLGAGIAHAILRAAACIACCVEANRSCKNLAGRSFCPRPGGGVYDFAKACA